MTVDDANTTIVVTTGSYVMTGTAKLLLQPLITPRPAHSALTLTIQTDEYTDADGNVYPAGTAATYDLDGDEFTEYGGGAYANWLLLNPEAGGQICILNPNPIIVSPFPS